MLKWYSELSVLKSAVASLPCLSPARSFKTNACVHATTRLFAGEVTLCHAIESEYGPMMLRQSVKPLLAGHPDKDIGAGIHSSRSCYHMNVLRDVEKEAQSEQQAITKTTDVCQMFVGMMFDSSLR